MKNNEHKTNLKFTLHIETEDVCKEKETDIIVDFYVNIEELNELLNYLRKYNINPEGINFKDLKLSESTPIVIDYLYNTAYDIAFKKHLKDLMWTEEDFYDEVEYFTNTEDLDQKYANYDMNTDFCDSESEYYEKQRMNESIMHEYDDRYRKTLNFLRYKIISKDVIQFNGILCELI